MAMRILYTNFHYSHGGGHTTYIRALLRNAEHSCYVACPGSSRLYKELAAQGFERLIDLDFPSKLGQLPRTIKNTRRLARIIEDYDIDIVHTNGSGDNRMALYASFICKKKFKVVYTKHNTFKVKGFISLWRLNKFNDAVIMVSDSVAAESGLAPNPRYHVVENGVDVNYWRRSTPPQTGREIVLASTAGNGENKGWMHLIEAIKLLPPEDRKRLSIVMMGRNDPFLVDNIKMIEQVCAFRWTGFLDDPRPELEKADVGFVLSHREACSFAAREMMSMGLPLLSSDFGASFSNVTPETGWITRRKDPASIKDALRVILDMRPEELAAMKTAARSRAESHFSLETMIARTNKVYAQLTG